MIKNGNSCVAASVIEAHKMGYEVNLPSDYIGIQNLERFEKRKAEVEKRGILVH